MRRWRKTNPRQSRSRLLKCASTNWKKWLRNSKPATSLWSAPSNCLSAAWASATVAASSSKKPRHASKCSSATQVRSRPSRSAPTSPDRMNLRDYLAQQQKLVDSELDRLVPPETASPATIHRAMRYSLFAGGKRIRPILCIEAARAVGCVADGVVSAACSLELIHTYSLIHDDLPSLDNDDYRRGKLTNHKVFGEAMAILAGDALLTLAFQVLAQLDPLQERKAGLVAELATAAGTVGGMIGGQGADLEAEGKAPDMGMLEYIYRSKTAA